MYTVVYQSFLKVISCFDFIYNKSAGNLTTILRYRKSHNNVIYNKSVGNLLTIIYKIKVRCKIREHAVIMTEV